MTAKRIEELENRIITDPYDIDALRALASIYNDSSSDFYDRNKYEEILKRINRLDPNNIEVKTDLDLLESEKRLEQLGIEYDTRSTGRVVVDSSENGISADVMTFISQRRYVSIIIFTINVMLLLAIIGTTVVRPFIFGIRDRQIANIEEQAQDSSRLELNSTSEYDGLYKKDIIGQRRYYVEKSMFNSPDYSPSDAVFGGIKDGKPWYGTENFVCQDSSKPEIIKNGDSYVSRMINNPAMLIAVNFAEGWDFANFKYKMEEYPLCSNTRALFMPASISYSPRYNMITTVFDVDNSITSDNNLSVSFEALNARDLGYKYGYVYNYNNIRFKDPNYNISTSPYEFQDYLAVGSSCGIKGGCNNICPVQNSLFFFFGNERYHEFIDDRAIVDFKLWKERPFATYSRPDMYYRIIFMKRSKWRDSKH